jgi:hypothetical protein
MTERATIIPASELARRRAEREQRRQERQQFAGSILEALNEPEQRVCVASEPKGTTR